MSNENYPIETKPMKGYKYIIYDGEVTDHGYFLPKQPSPKRGTKALVTFRPLSVSELVEILKRTSLKNQERLRDMKLV